MYDIENKFMITLLVVGGLVISWCFYGGVEHDKRCCIKHEERWGYTAFGYESITVCVQEKPYCN